MEEVKTIIEAIETESFSLWAMLFTMLFSMWFLEYSFTVLLIRY